VRPTKAEKEVAEFPFINKASDELKTKVKTSRHNSETSERPPVMNGSLTHNDDAPNFNGGSHSPSGGARGEVTLDLKPEKPSDKPPREIVDQSRASVKVQPPQKLAEPAEKPRQPTSPKPKVKREDLKQREEQLNNAMNHHLVEKKGEMNNLVPMLKNSFYSALTRWPNKLERLLLAILSSLV
jgi:hypothetical protein